MGKSGVCAFYMGSLAGLEKNLIEILQNANGSVEKDVVVLGSESYIFFTAFSKVLPLSQ
jgi:hypothetical protein